MSRLPVEKLKKQDEKRTRTPLFWLLAALAASVAVYIPSLYGGFALDDIPLIVKDPLSQSLRYFYLTFFTDFLRGFLGPDTAYYRPLVTISYQLNNTISGPNPMAFRLTNILLNAVAVWMVFAIAGKMTKSAFAAGVAALAFAVLPSHAESVAWISGRTDVLSTVFILAIILVFTGQDTGFNLRKGILCSVLFACALLCKENALILPVLLGICAWSFGGSAKRNDLWKWLAALVPPLIIYMIVRQMVIGSSITGHMFFMLKERLMNIGIAYAAYLRMLFIPQEVKVVYDVFPIGMKYPIIAAAAWGIPIGLIALAVWGRKRYPIISFAAGWILITLLPVTNLLPTIGPLPAERFVYLASVGSSILLGWIAWKAYEYNLKDLRTWPIIVAVFTGWFVLYSAALSIQGSQYYLSDVAWARAVRSTNTRFTMFRGAAAQHLERAGLLKEARAEYEVALDQGSDHPLDWIGLARVERRLGRKSRALELLTEAKDKISNNAAIYYQLGICYAEMRDMDGAASAFEQSVQINPKHGPAWRNLGKANLKLEKYDEAVSAFEQAFKLIEPSPNDRMDLEQALKRQGDGVN